MATSTVSRLTRTELPLRIVLVAPPDDILYGIQRGHGSAYDVDFAQPSHGGDVTFDFAIAVTEEKDGEPNFLGPFVQGPVGRRFIYVDVGKYARQTDTTWARRMIVRLDEITWPLIRKATRPGRRLEARIQGTGSDGGPSCATVIPIGGWKVVSD
jgi:hypothetical protein